MTAKRMTCLISMALLCVTAGDGHAFSFDFESPLKDANWNIHTPRGKDPAKFMVEEDGVLRVEADGSVSFLYQRVPEDAGAARTLKWRWRVVRDFEPTDLSLPGADDRPIALHVYFSDEESGLGKSLMGGLGRMFGFPVSGRVITYVWGGRDVPRTFIPNPFMDEGDGVLIIRQPSGSGEMEWRLEEADLSQDYKVAFGTDATAVRAIAISSDTDDTAAFAHAEISDLELHP